MGMVENVEENQRVARTQHMWQVQSVWSYHATKRLCQEYGDGRSTESYVAR